MANPQLDHQAFQDFPKLDAPMVDSNGRINFAWYRLFIRMWQALGLNFTSWTGTAFLNATEIATNPVTVFGIGPNGQPVPIGPVPIPGSAAADQIAFEALEKVLLPDPPGAAARTGASGVGVLQFLTPPDPSGSSGPDVDSDLLICVTGVTPILFAQTAEGLPVYVRGTL